MFGKHLLHFLKVCLGVDNPETQTTAEEQSALVRYSNGALNAVEIGVFEGFNTHLIARSLHQNGTLSGIDPFYRGRLGICWHKQIAFFYLRKKGVRGKIKIIQKPSILGAKDVTEGVDFIFVDGDHSLQGIKNDWLCYSAKVRQGGIIALHDSSAPPHQHWKKEMASVKYFEEVIRHDKRFKVIESVDSLNVLQRV